MTKEQKEFMQHMQKHYPRIAELWDFEGRSLDLEALRGYLVVASSGEAHIAKFYASVWLGHNIGEIEGFKPFDAIQAAKTLDPEHMRHLLRWLVKPCWP